MRIAMACSVVLGALALLPWDAAAQWAEKKVLTLGIAFGVFNSACGFIMIAASRRRFLRCPPDV